MLGALVSFCLMAIAAKELSGSMGTFQILFFRTAIGLSIVTLIITILGKPAYFQTSRLKLHSARNVFHLAGQYGWFVGIGLLPLAEVFAIEFTVPIWTALIALLFLHEKMTRRKAIALVLGFAGVLVIVQPNGEVINWGAISVLLAAVSYAIAYVATKSLSTSEHPLTIIFYMSVIQFPISFLFALSDWSTPVGSQWIWISCIGITALSAHFCIANAMKYSDASVVVTMDFLRLPAIALIGALLYSESLSISLIGGAILILSGNYLNIRASQHN